MGLPLEDNRGVEGLFGVSVLEVQALDSSKMKAGCRVSICRVTSSTDAEVAWNFEYSITVFIQTFGIVP